MIKYFRQATSAISHRDIYSIRFKSSLTRMIAMMTVSVIVIIVTGLTNIHASVVQTCVGFEKVRVSPAAAQSHKWKVLVSNSCTEPWSQSEGRGENSLDKSLLFTGREEGGGLEREGERVREMMDVCSSTVCLLNQEHDQVWKITRRRGEEKNA